MKGALAMKILMTTDLYKPAINGVVTSVETLKRNLESKGHDVRVLTLNHHSEISNDSDILYTSSINLNKVYPGARFTLSTNDKIYTDILKWQPDIIHSHCEFSTFRMAKNFARKLDIPIVHTYHTVYEDYTHYFAPNKKWGGKMVSLFSRHVLKHTDIIIAPTEKVKHLLETYQVNPPIQVIPTGIPMDKFNRPLADNERNNLKKRYNIPLNHQIILFLGRVAKEKNLDEIINFLAQIQLQNTTFLICGDGPHKEVLESLVAELHLEHLIRFTGMIDPEHVPAFYQLADVFVSASTSETQGLTYIEALLSGTPLLCRQDACLDHVVHQGLNGYTYTSFDEFRRYLTNMLHNSQKLSTMVTASKQLASELFTDDIFAQTVLATYHHALKLYHLNKQLYPQTSQLSKVVDTIKVWV